MKSVSQQVGPNDAQKKPNMHEQMNNPATEFQNAIPNVDKPVAREKITLFHHNFT